MNKQRQNLTQDEWLETNGLGGWAMSTISGMNTRTYHGLLVAATKIPVERHVMVSHLDERVECNGQSAELFVHDYGNGPTASGHLKSFTRELFPTSLYEPFAQMELEKTIAAINGKNTTVIRYSLLHGKEPVTLRLRPLIACRYYHDFGEPDAGFSEECTFKDEVLSLQPKQELPAIHIAVSKADFSEQKEWIGDFHYAVENYRGNEGSEKLFQPGILTVTLATGDSLYVTLSTETNVSSSRGRELFASEEKRRKELLKKTEHGSAQFRRLVLAADQFIVQREANKKTVIAGYPWFTDWGRDTMIALEGLCLSTKRYDEARLILQTFVEHLSQGMLPNRFPDQGEDPEYNTVDGTLWFFVAAYQYFQYTGDAKFIEETIYPAFEEIIKWHEKGTRYGIKEDADGLLTAGSERDQLTWMDAKVDDWVVTPRHGKAVEISALWYNALTIAADFAKQFGKDERAKQLQEKARKTKESFLDAFWNDDLGCCFDVITDGVKDSSIRPNQLFALSLPYVLLNEEKARSVLRLVQKDLVTPRGLRSLSPQADMYQPHYGGSRVKRDGAYHQGTVWSWLFGPYYFACQRFGDEKSKEGANALLHKFLLHLDEGAVGTIAEIFDGDAPHEGRGCPAQAWGVAELLRCLCFRLGLRNL